MNSDMKELFERNRQLEVQCYFMYSEAYLKFLLYVNVYVLHTLLQIENERLTTELHGAFDQTTALYEKIMLVSNK